MVGNGGRFFCNNLNRGQRVAAYTGNKTIFFLTYQFSLQKCGLPRLSFTKQNVNKAAFFMFLHPNVSSPKACFARNGTNDFYIFVLSIYHERLSMQHVKSKILKIQVLSRTCENAHFFAQQREFTKCLVRLIFRMIVPLPQETVDTRPGSFMYRDEDVATLR